MVKHPSVGWRGIRTSPGSLLGFMQGAGAGWTGSTAKAAPLMCVI